MKCFIGKHLTACKNKGILTFLHSYALISGITMEDCFHYKSKNMMYLWENIK